MGKNHQHNKTKAHVTFVKVKGDSRFNLIIGGHLFKCGSFFDEKLSKFNHVLIGSIHINESTSRPIKIDDIEHSG